MSKALEEDRRAQYRARWPNLFPAKPQLPALPDPTSIILGTDPDRRPVPISLRVRQNHILIIGGTGSGKSHFNFQYFVRCVRRGEGFLFIDPHGSHPDSTSKQMLAWLDHTGMLGRRKVSYLDFAGDNIIAFNPLALPTDTDVSVVVHKVMKAVSIAWAEEDTARHPTIERVFSISVAALIQMGLTLAELTLFLDREDAWGLRRRALAQIADPYIRYELQRIHNLSQDKGRRRDYDNDIIGPLNRLRRLLFSPALRRILGQTGNTFDARAAMDDNQIVIANVGGGPEVSNEDAELFARLLIREFSFHADRRSNTKPFNLVIDEASRVFSSDLPVALAGLRKRGVSIVASLQWLYQSEAYDLSILKALLNGCTCKVIFRLTDADDAELLARSNVPLDLEKPVRPLIKPTVVEHRIRRMANESDGTNQSVTKSHSIADGEAWSHTEGVAETDAHTEATSTGQSLMESTSSMTATMDASMNAASSAAVAGSAESVAQTVWTGGGLMNPEYTSDRESHGHGTQAGTVDGESSGKSHGKSNSSGSSSGRSTSTVSTSADTHAVTYSQSDTYTQSRVETFGRAETEGTSHSKGYSEGFEPIMKDLPTAVHGIENMRYWAAQHLQSLPVGTAYVNFMDKKGRVATTITIPPVLVPPVDQDKFPELRDRVMATSNGAMPMELAAKAIELRHQLFIEHKPADKPALVKPAVKKRLWAKKS